ncbi:MAG: TusE/DsrC/DsvC family sulfur relay protein [Burkholderiales bacterium]
MSLIDEIVRGDADRGKEPGFPHAPEGWTRDRALEAARSENLELTEAHWEALRALQAYYARHGDDGINLRALHDALDEKFHAEGGIRQLYRLFPGGPVAQGCRLAGLKPPAGATDKGFGSVA